MTGTRGGTAAELRRRWQALGARDRGLLLFMLGALTAFACWQWLLAPALAGSDAGRARVPPLQAQATQLDTLLARSAPPSPAAPAQLQQRLRQAGITETQAVLADSSHGWRLQVQAVAADALWTALAPALADPAVQVETIELERVGDPNMAVAQVSGRVVVRVAAGGGR